VSALCADFEPEARRYTKSGHCPRDLNLPETRFAVLLVPTMHRHRKLNIVRQAVISACFFCLSESVVSHAQPAATNLWTLRLPWYYADSSPATAPDGTIYQATFDGCLLAVTPQGEIRWTFKINSEIKSSPAIADDGTIYFGARDRKFYAVTPRGKLKWIFPTGAWVDASPAIGAEGTIYFGSWDNNFYALEPDGSKKWVFATSNIVVSSPAIGTDGTIYFGSHDKKFYALKPDGKLSWAFLTAGQIISSPAIAADGTVYFTSTDGNLYALRPDGSERWRFRVGSARESSPVLDESGNLYLSGRSSCLSVGSDGKIRWEKYPQIPLDTTPAVAADGLIYFSVPGQILAAIKPDGTEQWRVTLLAPLAGSPVIGNDGTIYGCDGSRLYAINSTNGLAPPAKSSWPMFRANPRHTGRVQPVN
jgi:outer membrane protein assembly factor BamB